MTESEIAQKLQTNVQRGIDEKEAEHRLVKYGPNEFQQKEQKPAWIVFLEQFKDFMVIVLLAATFISGLLGEYLDAITIILIVFMNGFLGFFQERKAEKSLETLKRLSAPQMTVLRGGRWCDIPAREAVPGDIVRFSSGTRIGADVRIIEARQLEIEESALTGESVPVEKHGETLKTAGLASMEQTNMAFLGTMVVRGNGKGIVVETGMSTEMGKIAGMLDSTTHVSTPLQRRLEELGKILISFALLLTALVVVIGIFQGHDLYKMFLAGVSLAVAAIPEGLPAIVTVVLALGVQRMIRQRALVRKLPAVETLGCATVICSDKTGTLTENKMTVTAVWSGGRQWEVTGSGHRPQGNFIQNGKKHHPVRDPELRQMLLFGMLCNNAEIVKGAKEFDIQGDPTEGALLICGMKAGFDKKELLDDFRIIHEFPFDSNRKMMSVVVENERGERFVVTKGAPDIVLRRSQYLLMNGRRIPLSTDDQRRITGKMEEMGKQALRTIAVATKPLARGVLPKNERDAESDLYFVGLFGMIDPPREEVAPSIMACKKAGIKTMMITGDHATTATAIARRLGILPTDGKVVDGQTLSRMSTEQLSECIDDIYVFARVLPDQKLKIVQALQKRGHIVAMTGDGVNDAPAVKAANIGIAMGKSGTDVTKEAASFVLGDDNFATIVQAVKEGRNIYENIRKFIRYLLASNVGEILAMLFAMLLGLPLPLVPIQILWVNLVTDGLPAMALGMDAPEKDVMQRAPRPVREGIFARGLGWKIVSRGFLIGVVTLSAFLLVYHHSGHLVRAQTAAFATLVLAQLIHVFDCRAERSVFSRNPFGNRSLILAVLSSVFLLIVVIEYPPLRPIFHTIPLHFKEWMAVILFAAVPTFIPAFLQRKRN